MNCDPVTSLYLYRQWPDTSTPSGQLLFGMLGVFSEFERSIRDRVIEGLDRQIPGPAQDDTIHDQSHSPGADRGPWNLRDGTDIEDIGGRCRRYGDVGDP